jgi:hypothetical protein
MILHEKLLSETDLKSELQAFLNDSYVWQQADQRKVIQSMLMHIGSVDSELRDGLIYGTFYTMILEKNLLDHAILRDTLDYCLTNLLGKGIGEDNSDSVFTRTFTLLLISLIVAKDNKVDFVEAHKIEELTNKLIKYLLAEKDVRGYVPVKGWAHSVAHASDAVDELVKSPKFKKASFMDILRPLWNMMLQTNHAFIHDEDERLLVPIFTMLEQGLQQQEVITLLNETVEMMAAQKTQLDVQHYRILRFNWKTLLKSFYIKTAHSPQYAALHQSVVDCLNIDK